MRELRVQSAGRPLRIFYAFDPRANNRSCSSAETRRERNRFYEKLRRGGRRPLRRASGATAKGGTDRMSGRHPFSELTKDLTPERRQRIDDIKGKLLAEMPLHELRRARALTQRELAELLQVNQPAVSKLEQRADAYVLQSPVLHRSRRREAEDRRRVSGRGRGDHELLRRRRRRTGILRVEPGVGATHRRAGRLVARPGFPADSAGESVRSAVKGKLAATTSVDSGRPCRDRSRVRLGSTKGARPPWNPQQEVRG